MEEIFRYLYLGFSVSLQPMNFLYCLIGVSFGTLVGVLPGFGPVAAMSLLFPITFKLDPTSAIIMLAGIYYGAMYGGSTTSILLNLPGEAASVITCLDGYQMARKGRAGPALGISAFGSFIGGTLSIFGLALIAPPLVRIALRFGPSEFFALVMLGLTLIAYLSRGDMIKALLSASLGLLLGTIGMDVITAAPRFTMGSNTLMDGLGLVPVAMGLFGISEILVNVERNIVQEVFDRKIRGLLPTMKDWRDSIGSIFRGSVIGFLIGILPGAGALISSFVSYAVEKKVSKTPEQFGSGVIQGVAGPETANNAATGGAFIPLMTLGIPPNPVMAILLGAFMVHGLRPGPTMMSEHPQVFWGVITSMYTGNMLLLLLNLPLIGLWVRVLKIPYYILFPLILLFCFVGVYGVSSNTDEIIIMGIFGAIGYILKKLDIELAPMILAYLLGPMLESNLRQALILSKGSFGIFFSRPISAGLLLVAAVIFSLSIYSGLRRGRGESTQI